MQEMKEMFNETIEGAEKMLGELKKALDFAKNSSNEGKSVSPVGFMLFFRLRLSLSIALKELELDLAQEASQSPKEINSGDKEKAKKAVLGLKETLDFLYNRKKFSDDVIKSMRTGSLDEALGVLEKSEMIEEVSISVPMGKGGEA